MQTVQRGWYHDIELAPGVFSQGSRFPSVALVRDALRKVHVGGLRCLDFGTMDGLIATLLSRRGAIVTAHDREPRTDHIATVKRAYNVDFDYRHGTSLQRFVEEQRERREPLYDIVVFAGVLYHMFDPLAGLARIRGLLRNGGIAVVETSAVIAEQQALFFNADGRFYPGTNYFQPSLHFLEYSLRFLRLRALECTHFHQHVDRRTGLQLVRVCVICRAEPEALPGAGDEWMEKHRDIDWAEFLDWRNCVSHDPQVVVASVTRRGPVIAGPDDFLDIDTCVRDGTDFEPTEALTQLRLNDSD